MRIMRNARAIIVVTISLVATLAAVATASIVGLERLADRELGIDSRHLSSAERAGDSAVNRIPRSFDGRDAGPLLSELSMMGIAAARASPIDRVATIQGTHRFDGEPMSFLFGVNFVSANYFEVLGLPTESRCGAFHTFTHNQALFNAAFLRQFRLDPTDMNPGLKLSAPGLNSDILFCGSVPDAQFDDVRADPRPTIYLPLERLGDLGALISAKPKIDTQSNSLRSVLKELAPGVTFSPWQSMKERVAEQLSDEKSLTRTGLAAFGAALILGVAISVFAVLSVAELLSRSLAIRSALGAPRYRLLWLLFVPGRMATRLLSVVAIILICLAALRRFALEAPDLAFAMLGGLVAASLCISAGLLFVMRTVNEETLRNWLGNRS